MKGLSILIPEYNCDCTQLVRDLHRQCASAQLPSWEIVVADDGSIDETAVNQNRIIGTWDNCTFIRNEQNMGRAAIRNFLAEKAQYDRLIFIDSDMCIVSEDFRDSCRFIPNPNPTTEYCSKYFDTFLLNAGKACEQVRANAKPRNNATGGVTH